MSQTHEAQTIGRCAKCQGIIERGTLFSWKGGSMPLPVHVSCPDRPNLIPGKQHSEAAKGAHK